ncbi:uncharacterized protein MONOS_820 [Monocercomonoides exilis]|uniref:uncharacterized protein n=1 Tax=Monocercomonoides exilis TaxID=2049356 RepID=UPI0035594F3A|nr:hypothetical protein MONOS_820 [Monocercomonoides exilis]|eukprot:MONOS_820.1-p1 / transcript=MONOS_820.1 / gene=MONOS_820 / organism=Monocercomonoides_exilis_PA203 / gene_product=unspecified product / transcript_product=unspecified product / location=Mono_scaffold00013:204811-205611(-) / protein_length=267 / sequence_SO=supercontig / SO=protein_coding / is_pseudo=false
MSVDSKEIPQIEQNEKIDSSSTSSSEGQEEKLHEPPPEPQAQTKLSPNEILAQYSKTIAKAPLASFATKNSDHEDKLSYFLQKAEQEEQFVKQLLSGKAKATVATVTMFSAQSGGKAGMGLPSRGEAALAPGTKETDSVGSPRKRKRSESGSNTPPSEINDLRTDETQRSEAKSPFECENKKMTDITRSKRMIRDDDDDEPMNYQTPETIEQKKSSSKNKEITVTNSVSDKKDLSENKSEKKETYAEWRARMLQRAQIQRDSMKAH